MEPGESAPTNLIAQFQFGTNQAGRVFEHRIGEDSVNTLGADEYEHLPRASWQLRDRHIWSFASSNVTTITINQLGKTKKYIRDPNNEWTFSPGLSAGSKHVNPFSKEDTLRRLGDLTAVYWNAEGRHGLGIVWVCRSQLQN